MFHPPSGYLGFPSQPGHHYNYVAHQAQPQLCFDPSMQHYWRSTCKMYIIFKCVVHQDCPQKKNRVVILSDIVYSGY